MFFPSNDTIQNFTEKTKHLAQKCSHQIQQHLQHQQHNCHNHNHDKSTTGNKKDKVDYSSDGNDDENNIGCIGFTGGRPNSGGVENAKERKPSFTYFCACTGGSLRGLAKKHKDGQATVKWYVKVTI